MNEHCGPYYLFCEVYGKTDQIEIIDETTLPDQSILNDGLSISIHGDVIELVNKNLQNNLQLTNLQYFDYLYPSNMSHTLTFYPTTKHNVLYTHNNRIVCVNNLRQKSSYTFINTPMKVGDVLVCKVLDCDANISSIILFGLTTCNPTTLQNQVLPDETSTLTQQYSSSQWFIDHDINASVNMYDELAFWFDSNGQINLSINNSTPIQLRNRITSSTDINSLTLYPFFDLYGQVTSLCLYNYSQQPKLNFNNQSNAKSLCLLCYENLADTQLLPCQCVLCSKCAAIIKRPSLLSDCPFDRKHITQIRTIP